MAVGTAEAALTDLPDGKRRLIEAALASPPASSTSSSTPSSDAPRCSWSPCALDHAARPEQRVQTAAELVRVVRMLFLGAAALRQRTR